MIWNEINSHRKPVQEIDARWGFIREGKKGGREREYRMAADI